VSSLVGIEYSKMQFYDVADNDSTAGLPSNNTAAFFQSKKSGSDKFKDFKF
jgi:hypothetical protein